MESENTIITNYDIAIREINEYHKGLKANTIVKKMPNNSTWTEVTLPYIDDGDCYISVYLKRRSFGQTEINDDGKTLEQVLAAWNYNQLEAIVSAYYPKVRINKMRNRTELFILASDSYFNVRFHMFSRMVLELPRLLSVGDIVSSTKDTN